MNARWVTLGVVVGCIGACGADAQEARPAADSVIAKVGAQSITRGALTTHLMKYYARAGLEQLIDRSVVTQEAARLRVSLTDAELDTKAAEVKRGLGDFEAGLKRQGISEETWRDRVRHGLLAEKVLDKKWPVKDTDLTRLMVRYARVSTRDQARKIITDAKNGVSFEVLAAQQSIDGRENRGLVAEKPFLRVEHPAFFKAATEAGLRVGQVTPQPIQSSEYWLVLKLEGFHGPETLRGKEREDAVRRIRAYRMTSLIPSSRKRYKLAQPVPVSKLIEEPALADDTVVERVGSESITRKALVAYLFEQAGKIALDQLVERSITAQHAVRQNVSVSDAEVAARLAEFKKPAFERTFQAALDSEGITEAEWRERAYYTYLAEKVVNARAPVMPEELERLTVRYIRVATRKEAEALIQAATSGAPFEQLVAQRSLDRKGDGFIRPRAFLRVDHPEMFETIEKAKLEPGQVLNRPVDTGGSGFAVLKLEARFGVETLTAKERDAAIRRINVGRMGPLLDAWRDEIKVEYTVPMKTLIAEAKS